VEGATVAEAAGVGDSEAVLLERALDDLDRRVLLYAHAAAAIADRRDLELVSIKLE
jgi:hypothetical protein